MQGDKVCHFSAVFYGAEITGSLILCDTGKNSNIPFL